jgi:hypothetical protein
VYQAAPAMSAMQGEAIEPLLQQPESLVPEGGEALPIPSLPSIRLPPPHELPDDQGTSDGRQAGFSNVNVSPVVICLLSLRVPPDNSNLSSTSQRWRPYNARESAHRCAAIPRRKTQAPRRGSMIMHQLSGPTPRPPHRRAGYTMIVLLGAGAVVALVGGWWWLGRSKDDEPSKRIVLHTVARDDFTLSVTERGEIESAGVTDVVSEVKAKNTAGVSILKIVPEGTAVKAGDFLVELDSSLFKEERNTQQIAVNTAEALVVESRNLYETALIAQEEYLDGTYVQERQTIESEVFVAEDTEIGRGT